MPEVYLVRHGQARLGTDDYDRLSEMGVEQSRRLGRYFAERGIGFDRAVIGGLKRHRQTYDAIAEEYGTSLPIAEIHDGLSEYDHSALFEAYCEKNSVDYKQTSDARTHFKTFKKALNAWIEGDVVGNPGETWEWFENRVAEGWKFACDTQKVTERLLIVSSGGPISSIFKQVVGTTSEKAVEINLQIRNASFSQFHFNERVMRLSSFNNIPHLDDPSSSGTITYG